MRSALVLIALAPAAFLVAAIGGCGAAAVGARGQEAVTTSAAPPATPAPTTARADDPGIPGDVVASWGMQTDFFIEGGFEILDWEDAKAVLREQDHRGGKQYHTGWLTIYTNDGRKLLTKQPTIDDFYRFMAESGLATTGFGTE